MDKETFWALGVNVNEKILQEALLKELEKTKGHIVQKAAVWHGVFRKKYVKETVKLLDNEGESWKTGEMETPKTECLFTGREIPDPIRSLDLLRASRLSDAFFNIAMIFLSQEEELELDKQATLFGLYTPSREEKKAKNLLMEGYEALGLSQSIEKIITNRSPEEQVQAKRRKIILLLESGHIHLH